MSDFVLYWVQYYLVMKCCTVFSSWKTGQKKYMIEKVGNLTFFIYKFEVYSDVMWKKCIIVMTTRLKLNRYALSITMKSNFKTMLSFM